MRCFENARTERGNQERLVVAPLYPVSDDWSPDGRSLLFEEARMRAGWDVWLYSGDVPSRFPAGTLTSVSNAFS